MGEKQIFIVIKEVGREPYIEPLFDNTQSAFQEAVGGNVRTVRIATDLCLIVNEGGQRMGLPFNFRALGHDFFGTVIAVGVKGEAFTSLGVFARRIAMDLMMNKGGEAKYQNG